MWNESRLTAASTAWRRRPKARRMVGMTMKRIALIAAAALACTAHAAYKCVDSKGVTLIGDTPPDGCANVVMYEVTPSGHVLRRIEPTPTPEQLKEKLEDAAKNKAANQAAAEQRRKDLALLATYADAKEFDVARDRNIEPIKGRIAATEDRMKQVDKRGKELADEMEFYKAGKSKKEKDKDKEKSEKSAGGPPSSLVIEVERNKAEKAALEKTLAEYQKEIEATKAKYEADKQRWLALRAGGWANTTSSSSGSTTPTTTKPIAESKK